jgi:hypothetical protein
MPLDQLESMVMERAQRLQKTLEDKGRGLADASESPASSDAPALAQPPAKPVADASPAPTPSDKPAQATPETDDLDLSASDITSLTSALVEAGLLKEATDKITPEVLAALRKLADTTSPGLYDLDNPDDLQEFVHAIESGSIPLGGGNEQAPGGPAAAL